MAYDFSPLQAAPAAPALDLRRHHPRTRGAFDHVLVLGVATDPQHPGIERLRRSARPYGIGVSLVGAGSPYPSHRFKVAALRSVLRRLDDAYELMLFVDAYDCLFLTGLEEILAKYRAASTPFLMGAEIVRIPDSLPPSESFPPSPTPYRHLNSGGFVARIDHLRRVLERYDRPELWHCDNDQGFWSRVYLDGGADIVLDHRCSIFQCQWFCEQDLRPWRRWRRHRRMRNRTTGSRPAIFHSNGFCNPDDSARWVLGRRDIVGARHWRPWPRWPWKADGVPKDPPQP